MAILPDWLPRIDTRLRASDPCSSLVRRPPSSSAWLRHQGGFVEHRSFDERTATVIVSPSLRVRFCLQVCAVAVGCAAVVEPTRGNVHAQRASAEPAPFLVVVVGLERSHAVAYRSLITSTM